MRRRPIRRAAVLIAASFAAAASVRAQPGRLQVHAFGVGDGLAHGSLRRIVADSSGFLWFCTEGGLSRFDGSVFVSYGKAEGLDSPIVSDLLEDSDGVTYWVATGAGLYRFASDRPPSAGRMFEKVDLPIGGSVRRLLLDRRGRLWIGTSEGLAVLEGERRTGRARQVLSAEATPVFALLEDGDGSIWVGTHVTGLYRIAPDGIAIRNFPGRTRGLNFIRDLLKGPDGRIWCTFFGGITRLHADPEGRANPVAEVFEMNSGVPSIDTTHLLAGPAGEILAGTTAGIARLERDHRGWRVIGVWTMREGLTSDAIRALAFDPAGNLWIGTVARGAMRLVSGGFRRYPEVEESASSIVGLIGDGADGMLVLAAVASGRYRLHHLTEAGHGRLDVKMPKGISYLGWGPNRIAPAREGGYWLATGEGLLRYGAGRGGGPERLQSPPDRRFGRAEGLPGLDIFWVAEDSRGTLWVSVSQPSPGLGSLARREAGAARFTAFPEAIGSAPGDLATSFAEDPQGTVWVGFWSGRVVRIDRDGRFTPVVFDPPIPEGGAAQVVAFDSRGRLWVSSPGLQVADDPHAVTVRLRSGPPVVARSIVSCAVEDGSGRLYFGTDRGLLRWDGRADAAKLFTQADGLPGDSVLRCGRDARGGLWFSDPYGLVRLTPAAEPDLPPPPPRARIAAIRVDGEALPVAPLGPSTLGPLTLGAGPHRVAAQFFAIGHTPGERILFQHRFEAGADWSVASDARTLEFPRLAPGRHRLLVRAVHEQGTAAPPPAVLELFIPAPIWQRGWFLLLAAAGLLAAAYVAYRVRVTRLLALERMRTRIATDLHDAVGADLSRISLLADFVQRDVDEQPARARTMLGEVARTARDAVREMSDIVWALKPRPDDLSQVLGRVRDFAADVAGPAGIVLRVTSDEELDRVVLRDEGRRELYLLLKEAVSNAIRHSGARTVELEVRAAGRGLVAELRDDGCGFRPEAPAPTRGGHGIGNMRARAERLGGVLSVESAPGRGTTVRVELPRA